MTGVDAVNLAIAVAGLIATVAGTYVAVREYRGRRALTGASAPPELPEAPQRQGPYDVVVAYAAGDADAAEALAGRLREAGLAVFLARWVEPGLVPLLESERALTGAVLGLLLFGPGTMADRRARDEYAVLLHRKHEGGLRFVPALVADGVALPPFAAIHQPLDLTRPGTAHHDREIARLVRVVRAPRRPAGA